jgi:hypothetical protein
MRLTSLVLASLTAHAALAQPLLEITRNPTNLHGFFLDVHNMQVGTTYGIGAKTAPSSDPFDIWSLISVFEAEAPAMRFTSTASLPQRTFISANLDNYVAPSVRILSPASNIVVSGDVPVQVLVTDILPLDAIEIYVGPTRVGSILPGQGGAMKLPSYWFPNGPQEIWVRVINQGVNVDTDGDGSPDSPAALASWALVPVTFSNELYMVNFSPLYSAYGLSYFAVTPHDYTFEVFRLNGELLRSESGTTVGGNINPPWNFTDLNGNAVNDFGYVFSLMATPLLPGEPAPSPSPPPGTNSPPPPLPPPPGGQQQSGFQGSSSGELLLVESGAVLSAIEAPQANLASDDLSDILAKIALMEPGVPPPLPPAPQFRYGPKHRNDNEHGRSSDEQEHQDNELFRQGRHCRRICNLLWSTALPAN